MAVTPIPTTRTSDALLMERLMTQMRQDQLNLLETQIQLSTGRRITSPSEDAPAALRAIGLQRLIEQKEQVKVNVGTGQSYLASTETALSNVSNIIADIRGEVLGVVDTVSSDIEREAAAQTIERGIQQLLDIANHQFRDRYLFAGGQTSQPPFAQQGSHVRYDGDSTPLQTFADIDLLTTTNVDAHKVFGAISPQVKGLLDLNPILTTQTKLADLQGGKGITNGSFEISDGSTIKTIDISKAETVGDVVKLIEANPPTGRTVTVRVGHSGLVVDIDDAGGGNLTIKEVGGGTTAAELGIKNEIGTLTSPISGADLNPKLTLTTQLKNILGTRPQAIVTSAGSNNDLVFEMQARGTTYNGVSVQYVNDDLLQAGSGLTAGNEQLTFSTTATAARAALTLPGADNDLLLTASSAGKAFNDVDIVLTTNAGLGDVANVSYGLVAGKNTLSIEIDPAATQLQTLVSAITAEGTFTATADSSAGEGYIATGAIQNVPAEGISTSTGNSGGDANTLFVHIEEGVSTAANVAAAAAADSSLADIVQVTFDDKDTTSPSQQGLGALTSASTAVTAGGTGTEFDQDSGLRVVNGGETHVISFHSAETVEDLLNTINGAGAGLRARISDTATGIDLHSVLSGSDFQIGENGGTTATDLGLRSFTEGTLLSDLNHGIGIHTAEGTDFTIVRNDGTEIDVDLSNTRTVGELLDLINNHASNVATGGKVTARLTAVGNGIELLDDNPAGTQTLTIRSATQSQAAQDLGLIPAGQKEATPSSAGAPVAAAAQIAFSAPDNVNNAFSITASNAGTQYNGLAVTFVNAAASGNQATVDVDLTAKTITIDVDPAATTAATVVDAINAEGTFQAALNQTVEQTNDGSGLITETGTVVVTAGGTPYATAQPATAALGFAPPNDANTAIALTANRNGTILNGVRVIFEDTLNGDNASAVYNQGQKTLTVQIDATQTTANTVLQAINDDGTFYATLDATTDTTNNGTGIVAAGTLGTTGGGTAEVITGADVNPTEVKGIFNTLAKLKNALLSNNLPEIQRTVAALDADLDRVSFSRAEIGARQQSLDVLQARLEDESIEIETALSTEIDIDFAEAIPRLTAQQAIYEASLRTLSQIFRLSLLDFV